MKESTKAKLRPIRLKYIQLMAKYGRGRTQFGVYNDLFQMTIMAGLGVTMWNQNRVIDWGMIHIILPEIPMGIVIPLTIFLAIFFVIWGFIDQKIIKLTQAENAYNLEILNPWMQKMKDDIAEIKEKLTKDNEE